MHKTKKLKRKIRRLCLLTGGRSSRSVTPEGKFFFPTVVQQTGVDVNVGPGYDDYDDEPASGAVASAGAGSKLKCADLLNAGFFNDLHPFPQVLTGGGGSGGDDDDDDDSESKFYHKNFNRHVIRPLYRSMRQFYRLLTRR